MASIKIESNLISEKTKTNASNKQTINDFEMQDEYENETDSETTSCVDFEEVDHRFGIDDELELVCDEEETFFSSKFTAPSIVQISTKANNKFQTQQQYLEKSTSEIETENATDLVRHRKEMIKLNKELDYLNSLKRIKTDSEIVQEEKEKKFLEEKKEEVERALKSAKSAPRHVSKANTDKFVLQKVVLETKRKEQKKKEEEQRKAQEEERKTSPPSPKKKIEIEISSTPSSPKTPTKIHQTEIPQAPIKRVYQTPQNTVQEGSQKFFWNFVESTSISMLPSILDFDTPISSTTLSLEEKEEEEIKEESEDGYDSDAETVVDEPIEISYERIQPTIQPQPKIEKREEWVTIAKKEKPKAIGLGGRNLIPQAISEVAKIQPQTNPIRKTQMCKSISSGIQCRFGDKCNFAHSESQLFVRKERTEEQRTNLSKTKMCQSIVSGIECKFGDRCIFAHSSSQLSIRKERTEEQRTNLPKTKMCQSIVSGIQCKFGNKCCFAHTIEELYVKECNFGDQCKLICMQGEKFYNANSGKVCSFIHPSESKQIYEKRTKVTTTQPKMRERTESQSTYSSHSTIKSHF